MLPIFLQTVQHLSHTFNELSLVIPVAPHRDVRVYVDNVVRSGPFPVVLITGETLKERYDAFNVSSHDFSSRVPIQFLGTIILKFGYVSKYLISPMLISWTFVFLRKVSYHALHLYPVLAPEQC
jgi:hypothetical protein